MSVSVLSKKKSEETSSWRINALAFLFFAMIIALLGRFYNLQIIQCSQYQALAKDQHSFFKSLVPKRGEFFMQDKNGLYPAAVNRETKIAYAVPKEIENPSEAALAVAPILQMDAIELKAKFEKPNDSYELLKHRLNDIEIEQMKSLKMKGLRLSDEDYRYYPSNELAANILGFVGWKGNVLGGRYGLESYFDNQLKGSAGLISSERDAVGNWIGSKKKFTQAEDGNSYILTLDHIVQYQVEKILKSAVERYAADGGNITIMEPNSGKILAMASYPTFDPNNYSQVEDIAVFRNPPVNDAYEPGSVFKAFTIAAGLDSNKITPDSTYVDTGAIKEAGYTIRNSDLKANGVQTMTNVLEKSLNTGVIYVEKQLGNKNFGDYVRRFGFGEPTGIDLIGEASGNIRNLNNLKSDIQFFTASFGQGITVTPIQLASAYSSLANGGTLMKPQIIDKIIHADGSKEVINPQEIRRAISSQAAIQTAQILRSVVVNGHGKLANVPGYLVAGKTGTAQVASSDSRGYADGKSVGSFAGFAPVDNPRFTIIVSLSDPKNVEWAESSAAPAFGEIMKFLLEYYNIEPTEAYTQKDLDDFNKQHTLSQLISPEEVKDASSLANTDSVSSTSEIKKKKNNE